MRQVINRQFKSGEISVGQIKIALNSGDDIPPLLPGLQYIYTDAELRGKVFDIPEQKINPHIDSNNGRPGMELRKIPVFGVLRLNPDRDYDRPTEMANNHKTIRQMPGHGSFADDYEYRLQTLKDNVSLPTPEVPDEINTLAVQAGHRIVKKKEDEKPRGRCDSFAVETDVHYPTDINPLYDAVRKVITPTAALRSPRDLEGRRQYRYNIKALKRLFRKARQLKRSTSGNPAKKDQRDEPVGSAHREYIRAVQF